jgi:hypothetical protein
MPPVSTEPARWACRQCGMLCGTSDMETHHCDPQTVQEWEIELGVKKKYPLSGRYFDSLHPAPPPVELPPIVQRPQERHPVPPTRKVKPSLFETNDPQAWPAQSFLHLYSLPALCAVYCALTRAGDVVYVGASQNLKQRFSKTHELVYLLREYGCDRIGWYEMPQGTERDQLHAIERLLIRRFDPPVNKRSKSHATFITLFLSTSLLEDAEAYAAAHLFRLDELVAGGLRLVLRTDPDDLLGLVSTAH